MIKQIIPCLFIVFVSFAQDQKTLGIGYGKGFVTGTKNADSLIDALCDSTKSDTNKPKYLKGGSLKGKRPKKDIMKTVMKNLEPLRKCYNKRLREKPKLKGKVSIYFKILSSGEVSNATVYESTCNDRTFENQIKNKIAGWKFDTINIQYDTTEVIYPFVFSR